MPKNTEFKNHRVVVIPKNDFKGVIFFGKAPTEDEYMNNKAGKLLASVKRHVDEIEHAYVDYDAEHTCSFCGREWTEKGRDYNGGCCHEDEENNPATAVTSAA